MTNKSFIVKYVFIVDIDKNENKNFDINFDKRESFNDTNFNIIVAQNICVFDVANKINSIKLVDEVEKFWIATSLLDIANETSSLKNKINIDIDFASFIASDVVDFFW